MDAPYEEPCLYADTSVLTVAEAVREILEYVRLLAPSIDAFTGAR